MFTINMSFLRPAELSTKFKKKKTEKKPLRKRFGPYVQREQKQ